MGRQQPLARSLEQSLGGELRPQFIEGTPERAFTCLFHVIEHQLVFAARLVQREAAARKHAHALARDELQPGALGLEHRATHLRPRVLEAEVEVTGAGPGDAAQFALDPDQRECAFQQVPRQRVELARREHIACGLAVAGGGHIHRSRLNYGHEQ